MSGTSLDGVDIAYCQFEKTGEKWIFEIVCAETIPYSREWSGRLATVENDSAWVLAETDVEYGHLLGRMANDFIQKHKIKADFIASHGHTVFHRPEKRVTLQIGKGAAIRAETGLQVINDFRALDVALGGQGAPLVPIGDRVLFGQYEYCLNLGGFANISFEKNGKRIAFDICPVNIVLNFFARGKGLEFDQDGILAESGRVDEELVRVLNTLEYYRMPPPKSLGKEWVIRNILPLVENNGLSPEENLATFCKHISMQIHSVIRGGKDEKVLVTGGGAFNKFLLTKIQEGILPSLIVPDPGIIQFKEALIFAFLGLLRHRDEINCLSAVTGARRNSGGGSVI